jgi:UDP-glucuronate 4-epimerase
VVCLRLFTVYGPRQRPDLAIRKFAELIDAGREIQVYGEGQTSRDYTYIDDIVQGIVASLHHRCSYDVFNLGSASPIALTTVIETLEQALDKKAKIRVLPSQGGDVPVTYADISKARAVLGYEPSTPFYTGVQNFVKWYRDIRKNEP